MAGETPGASNARNNKKKLRWEDDKSTNKIYASGNVSALGNQTAADSTLKPGQKPKAIPTPTQRADDKSSDKYYAEGGSARPRSSTQAGVKKLGPAPKLAAAPKTARQKGNAGVFIGTKNDVRPVIDGVLDLLQGGTTGIVVTIKAGESDLLKRARAALDLAVTREQITEEEYREVRLSYDTSAAEQAGIAEKLGVPQAKETVRTEDNETSDVDPLAFLKGVGDDPEDPVIDTSPIVTKEVDTTDDVASSPAPSYPTPGDDEDDNDFLKPKPEPEAVDTILTTVQVEEAVFTPDAAEVIGTPVETPAEEPVEEVKTTRKAKRSGRGS